MTAATQGGALIGRGSELAHLADLIRGAAVGRGSAVLIEGEPGIGKSSLVRTAVAEAADVRCLVFWGSGDELGQALPLLPLLEALRVRELPDTPGARLSSGYCAGSSPPTAARMCRQRWPNSCWR